MNKFRSRLIFGFISLVLVVLLGLGIILGQIFNSFYTNSFNQRLEKEANLVAMLFEENGIQDQASQQQAKKMGNALDAQITVLNSSGEIISDTKQSVASISEQVKQEYERMIRTTANKEKAYHLIDKTKERYFYIVPLLDAQLNEGHLLFSVPVESLVSLNKQIWALLISSLGLAFIVIFIIGIRITKHYIRPIEAATKVAIELARGNYKARTFEDNHDETGMLSQSINILARNLQDMGQAQEMQQDRLSTLIENMGSGLILIDGRGYINLINRSYKEIFNVEPVDYLYSLYYEAIKHKEIISLVEEIFMTEVKVRKQMLLTLVNGKKHFEVYGAPIIGTNDEWKGIVLVFHDISEIKKLEQMRKDFVVNVSHELRTPITSIKGFSETLLDGAMKDEKILENFLKIILKESDRLQSLIQDLLDLSKMEQTGFSINWQMVNITEVLEEVLLMLNARAEDKQISLEFGSNHPVLIKGDLNRLKQIFINLISNAITYTPAEGKVSVSIEETQSEIHVKVADTGIGITESELPRIFERFYRVDKARTRNSGGTGLGLAIVKHLVEAHHGNISVWSNEGHGSVFTIKFKKE
ncbi:two-component system phosphate regulon sensor histidine kinase PhoR [Bacillus mesophilus]|uniref:histidine kinase n=1 Tax=Bacillus mesophilus TaxID=1808955 RepID=A0A6M0Q6A8_9BACI|nr:ATP-binding protein [Bacillus mesophilus]MBM7660576.1 two-component system phosphate regulon sensor histidine kinase PhoR [Bacillus mesophilus]NEY71876.1 cell wall metabolism sensor histidine kinase WalK [Bacillus mesophilus]